MPGLTLIDREQCERWGECSYRNADRVEHYFWEGELVVKSIDIADVGDQQIEALGIGTARSLDEVMERVRRFLPEAKVDCLASSDGARSCAAWRRLDIADVRHLAASDQTPDRRISLHLSTARHSIR